tara:strand:- start:3492 stop:5006 length:1515 start_codon:yes stop_codon:yes gene_type:complete
MNKSIMVMNKNSHYKKILNSSANSNFIEDKKYDVEIKYKDLEKYIFILSKEFERRGVKRNSQIVLIIDNSWLKIISFFSFLSLNCKVFTFDKKQVKNIDQNFLNKFKPFFYITDNEEELIDTNILCQTVLVDIDNLYPNLEKRICGKKILENVNFLKNKVDLNYNFDCEFLLTTSSGTSGDYKVIQHNFKNLEKCSLDFIKFHNLNSPRLLHVFSMSYMAGILNSIFIIFFSGGTVVYDGDFDTIMMINFWRIIEKNKVDTLWLAPSMTESILKLDRNKNSLEIIKKNIKRIFTATAALENRTYNKFKEIYNLSLIQTYGISEELIISSNIEMNKFNSAGKILENVQLKFNKDKEILVKSPFSFKGYWGVSKKKGWFKSGDIGSIDKSKMLSINDRSKDIIIKSGKNISPFVIEKTLREKISNINVAVVGVNDKLYGEKICLFYEKNKDLNLNKIKEVCFNNLSKDLIPDYFVVMNNLPKTFNGKIKKNELKINFKKEIYDFEK